MPIRKLILLRKDSMHSNLVAELPFAKFVVGEPWPASPADQHVWRMEAGLSHYALLLEGMKLKDWDALQKFQEEATLAFNIIALPEKPGRDDITDGLKTCGLIINTLALEDDEPEPVVVAEPLVVDPLPAVPNTP